jgi:hypothetical protein
MPSCRCRSSDTTLSLTPSMAPRSPQRHPAGLGERLMIYRVAGLYGPMMRTAAPELGG